MTLVFYYYAWEIPLVVSLSYCYTWLLFLLPPIPYPLSLPPLRHCITLSVSGQMDQLEYEANEGRLFGRGSRARKTVDYSEMLTEREWLKVIDCSTCSVMLQWCAWHTSHKEKEPPPHPPTTHKVNIICTCSRAQDTRIHLVWVPICYWDLTCLIHDLHTCEHTVVHKTPFHFTVNHILCITVPRVYR